VYAPLLIALGLRLGVLSTVCAPGAAPRPSRASLADGQLVDIGGRRLFLACRGEGAPTVVFEAGAGSMSGSWWGIWTEVSRFTRACIYDRAGRGRSDARAGLHTGLEAVEDLRRLLDLTGIDGPYVLVGHSLGGVYARLFASEHRDETAGLVFVDSLPPDPKRLLALLPRDLQLLIRAELEGREGLDLEATARQLRDEARLGDLPLIVLSAAHRGLPSWFTAEQAARLTEAWRRGHEELAALSSNGRLVIAEKSGHDIQYDEPDLVLDAIHQIVAEAWSNARGQPFAGEDRAAS
jgi:pimeloyl-ACP methyl ester carboxylesterase